MRFPASSGSGIAGSGICVLRDGVLDVVATEALRAVDMPDRRGVGGFIGVVGDPGGLGGARGVEAVLRELPEVLRRGDNVLGEVLTWLLETLVLAQASEAQSALSQPLHCLSSCLCGM